MCGCVCCFARRPVSERAWHCVQVLDVRCLGPVVLCLVFGPGVVFC